MTFFGGGKQTNPTDTTYSRGRENLTRLFELVIKDCYLLPHELSRSIFTRAVKIGVHLALNDVLTRLTFPPKAMHLKAARILHVRTYVSKTTRYLLTARI